jgi:hypothetical protein
MRVRRIILALAILMPPLCAAWAQETIEALAQRSTQDAAKRLLTMPAGQRAPLMQRLLRSQNARCRDVAVDVIEETFAVQFLPALQQVAKGEHHGRFRERIEKVIETLTLYKPIAVEGLEDSAASTKTAEKRKQQRSFDEIFGAIGVQPQVLKSDGGAAAGCTVQAYSEAYGVCVPDGRPRKADKAGPQRLDLFPGKWTFFAAGGGAGKGLYVCSPAVEISKDKAVSLKASRSVSVTFCARDRRSLDVNEVYVIDTAFAGFLDAAQLGPSADGRLQVLINDRAFDIVAVRQPTGGTGYVLHAEGQAERSSLNLSGEKSQCGRLIFKSQGTASPVKDVEIFLSLRSMPERGAAIKAQLPLELCVSPGVVDVAYSYLTEGNIRLEFARKAYTMREGTVQEIVLGGPYECSVFHQFYKEFVKRPNVLVYYLFVRDPNNHCLHDCSKAAGRRREQAAIPISVLLNGNPVFDTSRAKPDRPFWSEAGSIPSEGDLDKLEYKVVLPFVAGKGFTVKGHGADSEKTSEHFSFQAPHELDYTADSWLQGAEAFYKIYSEMLGHDPHWRGGKGEIRFRVKMPPGVGAFAGGRSVNFTIGSGMSVTQPWRILNSAFRHELLHTFGHGHRDFMHITCQEAGVQYCDGSPAARRKRDRSQDEILTCLRGGTGPRPDAVVPEILLEQYGYKLFKDYVEKGRPKRDALQARGLSETEGDCAIFSWLTHGEALGIYKAAGVQIDEAKIKTGMNFLMENSGVVETARRSPERREAGQALREMEKAFQENRKAEALKQADEVVALMPGIGDYRMRTWSYCRTAELLYNNEMKERAKDLLKEAQRAAAEVDSAYLHKIRYQCLKVLKGGPLLRINFF